MGVSRILMNTTSPGDKEPTFSVHPHPFDTGSYGMGVAVDDLDQDGHLDIYNTSVERDLLAAGRADGSYEQVAGNAASFMVGARARPENGGRRPSRT